MINPKDIKSEYLIVLAAVLGLWSNVTSTPNPLAKQNLQVKLPEVDLGYNSTAAEGVNDVVRIVVNLVKVSRSRFRLQLHGNSSYINSTRINTPVPHDGVANETVKNLTAVSGTHDIKGGPSMVDHLINSTTNVEGIVTVPLESVSWEDKITCDAIRKEVLDLLDLEAALIQLLDATRERLWEFRNGSLGSIHQNCFSTSNNTLGNDTEANLMVTSTMNATGGVDVDITEPIISLINNATKAESRSHKRQSLKEFTDLVTTLVNTLQGMGQKVMMMQQLSPKGTKAENVSPSPGPIDMVCGDPLRKPSTMAEYVMGKNRRR